MTNFEKEGQAIWNELLAYARELYSAPSYAVWIDTAQLERIDDDKIYIHLPNETAIAKWTDDFQGKIIELAYKYTGRDMLPVFDAPSSKDFNAQRKEKQRQQLEPFMKEKAKSLAPHEVSDHELEEMNLNPNFTLDNFIQAENNRIAWTAAVVTLEKNSSYNPLLIYGETGLGKTHLMQAIGIEKLKDDPNAVVRYVNAASFVDDYITAIRRSKGNDEDMAMEKFKDFYRNVDLLLLDDIQFFEGRTETQNEFFHTFEAIFNRGGQIITTSDRLIDDIPTLQDRLISRFKRGISCEINKPDSETRIAILCEKAADMNLDIPEDGIEYIASLYVDNIRELEGALRNVDLYVKANNASEITVSLIADALQQTQGRTSRSELTIVKIQDVVSDYFNVTKKEILGPQRRKEIAYARQVAMYLSRDILEESFPNIGREFGGKDHTTVMHSCDKITKLLKTDERVQDDIRDLTARIKAL